MKSRKYRLGFASKNYKSNSELHFHGFNSNETIGLTLLNGLRILFCLMIDELKSRTINQFKCDEVAI